MKLSDEFPESFTVYQEIKKNSPLNDPNAPNLLVFEIDVPFWGVLRSTEFRVFRDDFLVAVDDIGTRTIGITKRKEKYLLKFQMCDTSTATATVADHDYKLVVTVNFLATLQAKTRSSS